MALTDEQRKAAEEIFGSGLAAQIITEAETESKKLENAGIAHKSGEPAEVTPPAEAVTVETVVTELVKQLDLSQLIGTIETVAQQMAAVTARLDKLEHGQKFTEENEMPRYVLQLKRASEAAQTIVAEGDALKEQKPKETKVDGSLAGSFFTPVK